MITKMKKLILFMSESEVDADLTLLGQLGVMHVTPFQPAKDESIDRAYDRIKHFEKAISVLEEFDSDPLPLSDREEVLSEQPHGETTIMDKILKADERLVQLGSNYKNLMSYKQWYSDWGNVDIEDIKKLKKLGVFFRLYQLNKKEYDSIGYRSNIVLAGQKGNLYKVILISENADEKLNFEEVMIPRFHCETLDICIREAEKEINLNRKILQSQHAHINMLREALDERVRRYKVRSIQYSGYSVEEVFSYWQGYIPVDSVDELSALAEKRNWGYLIQEPTAEEIEEVPTLIRSPKWADQIRPVMNFMGLVPGYNELDVSNVFMIFFTFFSGILVGDAGYGLVFFLITLFAHYKQKFKPQIEFSLLYTLSSSIMLWGIFTGTYFGVKEIAEIPFLSNLIIHKIASFGGDEVFLQKFMFIIGAVHLTIGHLQVAWKYSNSVKAISQLGWVAIVWGLYFFINQMVLSTPAPGFMPWMFVAGILLVALFSNPGPNFFKGIVTSLAGIPLNVISGFSDIISYIRLYAVGLATVLMAVSFNEMAIGDGVTTLLSGVVAILILILGHGLNMILAAMAIIVHGVRLNMLEYAGHAGVEFSGNEYNPFKLKNGIKY